MRLNLQKLLKNFTEMLLMKNERLFNLLFELIENSKCSDRELAKLDCGGSV